MTHPANICVVCVHLNVGTRTCAAYPQRIPEEIWDGRVSHREPYEGDQGIQYRPDPVWQDLTRA